MSGGSFAGGKAYVNKVMKLREMLRRVSDSRRAPQIEMWCALETWFFGLMRRLPSTEKVGEMMQKSGWQKHMGLRSRRRSLAKYRSVPKVMGSADTLGRVLDKQDSEAWQKLSLDFFFTARRAGLLSEGPFGMKCGVLDMNELFKSEKRCCEHCQERQRSRTRADGSTETYTQYYHQAVLFLWVSEDLCWPIDWELLKPGEGELTASLRLLDRVLPRLGQSLDIVMGDQLYNCRPFFLKCLEHSLDGLAAYSPNPKRKKERTELDAELELLKSEEDERLTLSKVALWEMESEAWQADLRTPSHPEGVKLRRIEMERRYEAPDWIEERQHLRVVTTAPASEVPAAQCWKLGRGRWMVENQGFNTLTQKYALTHNYRHSAPAILVLLILRGLACAITLAYRRHATARSIEAAGWSLSQWFDTVIVEDIVPFTGAGLASSTRPKF